MLQKYLTLPGYVVGYAIVYQKGYQAYDTALSSVSTKVPFRIIHIQQLDLAPRVASVIS